MIFVGIFTLVGISLFVATAYDLKDESKIRDINTLRSLCKFPA
jgi:hypothetical protein